MKENSLLSGKVLPALIKFSLPIMAALFLQSLYGGVDLLIVGKFATTADVSAVSTGSTLMQTVTMVITGLTVGVTVLVGQKIGAKRKDDAGKVIGAGIVLFLLLGVVLSIILIFCTEGLATVLQAPEEAYSKTCDYIRVCGIGTVFIVFYNLIGAIFRGIGDSKTPLFTVLIACVCNIIGDLVFAAWLGFGAMGTAIATVISQAISVVVSVLMLKNRELPFEFHKNYIRFDGFIAKILKLGFPIALQEFLVGISFLVIMMIVNAINVNASAGVGIAEKVCSFIMLVPSAFSQAISAFVAQNIGAGYRDRADSSLKYGIVTSLCIAIVIAALAFFRGDLLAGIFSNDGIVIANAHEYLKAYAIDVLQTSILFCFIGYYNGCGNTLFVMIQGLVGAVAVRIPVVFLMSRIPDVSLFLIGLSTPIASFIQIILCLIFMAHVKRKARGETF